MKFKLGLERYAICRLEAAAEVPSWVARGAAIGSFSSITRTPDELSIICEAASVPSEVKAETGFRALQVMGPLDFEAVGIMEFISGAAGQSLHTHIRGRDLRY